MGPKLVFHKSNTRLSYLPQLFEFILLSISGQMLKVPLSSCPQLSGGLSKKNVTDQAHLYLSLISSLHNPRVFCKQKHQVHFPNLKHTFNVASGFDLKSFTRANWSKVLVLVRSLTSDQGWFDCIVKSDPCGNDSCGNDRPDAARSTSLITISRHQSVTASRI